MTAATRSEQTSDATVASLLDLIGKTPVVELRRVIDAGDGGAATVYGKCEQFNPGGSVKDRIALSMIEAAEQRGEITPGKTVIVEPTSGNTGIGLALVCAAKNYKLVLTMPESMSLERRALLASYGADIVLTAEDQVMPGAVEKARALCNENPDYYMPDQFRNPANPQAHRDTTAREILEQLGDQPIDALVSAIGTGGTITGVGQALVEKFPDCRIVGVEPATSAVIGGNPAGPHKIQGIGAGFVPDILDRDLLTDMVTVRDRDAYEMSKRLATEEGLLVGISAGANVFVAAQIARELGPGKRVVTFLCDTGERYFSLDEYFTDKAGGGTTR